MRHSRKTKQAQKNTLLRWKWRHAQIQNQIQIEKKTELKKTHKKHITTVRNISQNDLPCSTNACQLLLRYYRKGLKLLL